MIFVFEVCQEEWKQTVSAVHWQREKVRLPSSGPALSIISANERPFFLKRRKRTNRWQTFGALIGKWFRHWSYDITNRRLIPPIHHRRPVSPEVGGKINSGWILISTRQTGCFLKPRRRSAWNRLLGIRRLMSWSNRRQANYLLQVEQLKAFSLCHITMYRFSIYLHSTTRDPSKTRPQFYSSVCLSSLSGSSLCTREKQMK